MDSELFTIVNPVSYEVTIKRSVFLAELTPATDKEVALATIEAGRREHKGATHNCYAYRLGNTGLEYRMSDDGEPSGTAGKPILFCLQKSKLTNVVLLVNRWYGGVKLGSSGLARAYAECATEVIGMAEIIPALHINTFMVYCEYQDESRITNVLAVNNVKYSVEYGDTVCFRSQIPLKHLVEISKQVTECTNGRGGIVPVFD